MKVCLLYKDRERSEREKYYDTESIIGDLGLKTLILSAAKRLVFENGKLKARSRASKKKTLILWRLSGMS